MEENDFSPLVSSVGITEEHIVEYVMKNEKEIKSNFIKRFSMNEQEKDVLIKNINYFDRLKKGVKK